MVDGNVHAEMDKIKVTGELKHIPHLNCLEMTKEIQNHQIQIMEIYKNNSTYPFDFYSISLKEGDTKIQAIRELYKRITNEEL